MACGESNDHVTDNVM